MSAPSKQCRATVSTLSSLGEGTTTTNRVGEDLSSCSRDLHCARHILTALAGAAVAAALRGLTRWSQLLLNPVASMHNPFSDALHHMVDVQRYYARCERLGITEEHARVWLNRADGDVERAWSRIEAIVL